MDPEQHEQVIEDTIQQINTGVFDNLKALENRIADLVAQGGDPQTLRPTIVAEFEQYARSVKQQARGISAIAEDTIGEGTRTTEDDAAISALSNASADSVANEVITGSESVITALTLAGAAGVTADQLAKIARARVSGVFMETDDVLTRRAQRTLTRLLQDTGANREEIAQATRVIRDRLSDVNVTNSVRDLASKRVNDVVMQFDGAFTKGRATRAGIQRFRYEGGLIRTSRDWCSQHQGAEYTEEEIRDLWNDNWAGKEPGDPFVVRGGYNCRHFWVPIESE